MKNSTLAVLIATIPFAFTTVSAETATLTSKDTIVGDRMTNAPALGYDPGGGGSGLVGVTGSSGGATRENNNLVLGYTLPTLPAGTTLTAAVLHFEITGSRDHNNDDPLLDVYLLDTVNPDSSGTDFYFHGDPDPNPDVAKVGSKYIEVGQVNVNYPDDVYDMTLVLTGDALTLLQSFYGGDNVPDQTEAFFRFNMNVDVGDVSSGQVYNRYYIDTATDETRLDVFGGSLTSADLGSNDMIVGEVENVADNEDYVADVTNNVVGVSGGGGDRTDRNVVFAYTLPTLPVGTTVETVNFRFEITEGRKGDLENMPDLQVYLLDTANPDGSGTDFFFHGASDPSADVELVGTKVTYVTDVVANSYDADFYDCVFTLSGDALTLFKSFYGGDNVPNQSEVFFRFNMDEDPAITNYVRYRIDTGSTESGIDIFSIDSGSSNTFVDWIDGFPGVGVLTGFDDDADGDGIKNGVENFFGTDPSESSTGLEAGTVSGSTFTFTHPQNETPADDVTVVYRWSKDLSTFNDDAATDGGGTTVTFGEPTTDSGITTVTATVSGTATSKLFVRVEAINE